MEGEQPILGSELPIEGLSNASTCWIPKKSGLAQLIYHAKIIVWDEVSMINKYQIAAVERSVTDVMEGPPEFQANRPFGGKSVILAGDFCQVLPVIRHGEWAKIIQMSLKQWNLWQQFETLQLTKNMRVQ